MSLPDSLALVGTSTIPAFLSRSVLAEVTTAAANNRKLVVLFQRGAADGLNVVVPYKEKNYYAMRPSIAIQEKDVLDLNGFFGLHPAMTSFKSLYEQGHLAIVQAAGSPDTTRSHFDAQDYMESGTPGVKATSDGWLNRALQAEILTGKPSAFRAVALGTQVPRTLQGKISAIAVNKLSAIAHVRNVVSIFLRIYYMLLSAEVFGRLPMQIKRATMAIIMGIAQTHISQ